MNKFENDIETVRDNMIKRISESNEDIVNFDYRKGVMELLLFKTVDNEPISDENGVRNDKARVFAIDSKYLSRIDFSEISFDNFVASGVDFSELKGVKINPQKIYNRDFTNSKLKGVTFVGPFNGARLYKTDFTGSNNAYINPKYVDSVCDCILSSVTFTNPITDTMVIGADFTGSNNAHIITTDDLHYRSTDLARCKLQDACLTVKSKFHILNVRDCDFTGAHSSIFGIILPLRLNPSKIGNVDGTVFNGVIFTEPFSRELEVNNSDFTGSKHAIFNYTVGLNSNNLTDCKVFDNEGEELAIDENGKIISPLVKTYKKAD